MKKGLKVVLIVVGLFVLLGIIGAASGGSNNKTQPTPGAQPTAPAEKPKPAAETPKLGEAVRDGKFEFVAKKLECGKAEVGDSEYLRKQAQGQFCLLSVSVKNIGKEAQTFFAENQYLYNGSGQRYSADSLATSYVDSANPTWYSNINPGNEVSGVVVFDVPKDQTPATAELHDSMASGGVKVSVQ